MQLNVSQSDIEMFRKDLYKDTRKLEYVSSGSNSIRRYSDSVTSIGKDLDFLNQLEGFDVSWKHPKILSHTNEFIEFEYLKGIRLFNFIIELRYLYLIEKSQKALQVAERIKLILVSQLTSFQDVSARIVDQDRQVYPYLEKSLIPINILNNILKIGVDNQEVAEDVSLIADLLTPKSKALFRDASPKNAILNMPELFYSNFKDDADRRILIRSLVEQDYFTEERLMESLYQLDFSGCIFLCPRIDDFIAIHLHESMEWMPSSKEFLISNIEDKDFLCTLFIRLLRFGVRKLLYRLLHRDAHKVRFRFDYERTYFSTLRLVTERLESLAGIKGKSLKLVFSASERATACVSEIDYFKEFVDTTGTNYYSDIFPN